MKNQLTSKAKGVLVLAALMVATMLPAFTLKTYWVCQNTVVPGSGQCISPEGNCVDGAACAWYVVDPFCNNISTNPPNQCTNTADCGGTHTVDSKWCDEDDFCRCDP